MKKNKIKNHNNGREIKTEIKEREIEMMKSETKKRIRD